MPHFNTTGPTLTELLLRTVLPQLQAEMCTTTAVKSEVSTPLPLDLCVALAINTTGLTSISVSFDANDNSEILYDGTLNTRINELILQYRVGTSGAWSNVTGTEYQNNTTLQTSGTTPQNSQTKSATLPPAADNQPVVQLRWASRQVGGAGSRPGLAVDNISISGSTAPPNITVSTTSLTNFGNVQTKLYFS